MDVANNPMQLFKALSLLRLVACPIDVSVSEKQLFTLLNVACGDNKINAANLGALPPQTPCLAAEPSGSFRYKAGASLPHPARSAIC